MRKLIQTLPLFANVSNTHLEAIEKIGTYLCYAAWDIIIKQWANDTFFYILVEGIVSVVQDGAVITTLFEGDIFWEISLVTNEKRIASIIAENPVKVLRFEKNTLFEIIKKFDQNGIIQKTLMNRIIMNHKK